MRNHSSFIQELTENDWSPAAISALASMTRDGVAPEGRGQLILNQVVDSIYAGTYDFIGPVPAPPIAPPRDSITGPETFFVLGDKSKERLQTLKPALRAVVEKAITLSLVDFTVFETVRTSARQKELLASGKSRTMQSKHLPQEDGFAHAVDLVHWVDGKPTWESWDAYGKIAFAVDQAATMLGCADRIRWGGAWDRRLSDFGGQVKLYLAEVEAYKKRHAGSDFIDGPHFEWVS